jgi:hypothetical protein
MHQICEVEGCLGREVFGSPISVTLGLDVEFKVTSGQVSDYRLSSRQVS